MPTGWRILKSKYRDHAFDGEGARLYGGRWNGPGFRMIYTADSIALAVLEILVHLEHQQLLADYQMGSADFPESLVEDLDLETVPPTWRRSPGPAQLQRLGNEWVTRGSSAVLRVPSVITGERESNYLVNPAHPDFHSIELQEPQPFWIDPRLG